MDWIDFAILFVLWAAASLFFILWVRARMHLRHEEGRSGVLDKLAETRLVHINSLKGMNAEMEDLITLLKKQNKNQQGMIKDEIASGERMMRVNRDLLEKHEAMDERITTAIRFLEDEHCRSKGLDVEALQILKDASAVAKFHEHWPKAEERPEAKGDGEMDELICGCGGKVRVFDQGRIDVDWRGECRKCYLRTKSWGSKSAAITAFKKATRCGEVAELERLLYNAGVEKKTRRSEPYKPHAAVADVKDIDSAMEYMAAKSAGVRGVKGLFVFAKDDEKKAIARAHHGLGQRLRNELGLWQENELTGFFNALGIEHADDMSGILLTCFHRILNNLPYALDSQVAACKKYWQEQAKESESGGGE